MSVRRASALLMCSTLIAVTAPSVSFAQIQRYSDEGQVVNASYNSPDSPRRIAKRKAANSKIAGCIMGGIVGGLLGAAMSNRQNRTGAVVAGATLGCFAGFAFASNWSQRDQTALDTETQDVFDRPQAQTATWVAPDSREPVTLTSYPTETVTEKVEFETYDNVAPPTKGAQVVARPYRAREVLRLRSSPDTSSDDNIIGRFDKGEVVEVVGATADSKWAMVGDDGVIAGYASFEYLGPMDSGQSLRKTPTAKLKRTPAPSTARTQLAANTAPAPAPKIKTVKVLASTQCKTVVAVSGQQSDRKRGCATPNGDWKYA